MYEKMTCARVHSQARQFLTRYLTGVPNASKGIDLDSLIAHTHGDCFDTTCIHLSVLLPMASRLSPTAFRSEPSLRQHLRDIGMGHLL